MNNSEVLPAESGLRNIDRANLWRLETVGDLMQAEIQIYHPVLEDGSPDPARKPKFCSLMDISYRGQNAKMRFNIPGETLKEALDNFFAAGEAFGHKTLDELESERLRVMLSSGITIGEQRQ